MQFVKRPIRLLEKVDRFLKKGLHLFGAKDISKSKVSNIQSENATAANSIAQDTDAPKVNETPSLGIPVASNDAFPDEFDTANSNDGDGNLEDASSNSDSEDSWYMETPPLKLNYDALKHVATHFLPGSHGACIDISTLPRGMFHEIRILHFEDGWTCIGRFTRDAEPLSKVESELATLEYVRKHTTIPVPGVYLVSHSDNDCVGSPYVLMEHMHGSPLDDIWEDLSLDHKLDAIKQLAGIHAQLASQKFDTIGPIKADGSVGPLLDQVGWWQPLGDQAFTNTSDYINSHMKENNPDRRASARALYPAIKEKLSEHLEQNAGNPTLNAPYRLIHPDFNFRNFCSSPRRSQAPQDLRRRRLGLELHRSSLLPLRIPSQHPRFGVLASQPCRQQDLTEALHAMPRQLFPQRIL